ncbi:hypothetical protein MPER_03818, partial [Moniliophthora perniciosa FA553]
MTASTGMQAVSMPCIGHEKESCCRVQGMIQPVQIWRMDPTDTSQDYPFTCRTVIHTGHRANIFNVHLLPYSSRIVTVAGDKQVRVFDVGEDVGMGDRMQEFHTGHALTHTFRCHEDRVKRIVTENSPDVFLTVSEDGS